MEMEKLFEDFKTDISSRVFDSLGPKGLFPEFKNPDHYKRLLFDPYGTYEEALSQNIWKSLDTEKVFRLKKTQDLAHRITEELVDYKDAKSYEYYINALKIVLKESDPKLSDPNLIDIF